MPDSNQHESANEKARQQAKYEEQIVQIEESNQRRKDLNRRGCLGCAVVLAVPISFYAWQICSIIKGMREAGDFERRVRAVGGTVRFSGGDDMGRGLGVRGVSTIAFKNGDLSDNDMPKLAPLLVEAERFGGLYLYWTQISDEGLQYFPAGVKLGRLDLRGTAVTKDGIDQLILRLPDLQETMIVLDEGALRHHRWRSLDGLE